jgi:hypothetical protein
MFLLWHHALHDRAEDLLQTGVVSNCVSLLGEVPPPSAHISTCAAGILAALCAADQPAHPNGACEALLRSKAALELLHRLLGSEARDSLRLHAARCLESIAQEPNVRGTASARCLIISVQSLILESTSLILSNILCRTATGIFREEIIFEDLNF